VTPWQVAYRVSQIIEIVNGSKPTISVTGVGIAGAVVEVPKDEGSLLDRAFNRVEEFADGLAGGGADVLNVLKWGIIALIVIAVIWLVVAYGLPAAGKLKAATG
jgi:hypothetical protein